MLPEWGAVVGEHGRLSGEGGKGGSPSVGTGGGVCGGLGEWWRGVGAEQSMAQTQRGERVR